jgi:NAD(P)-dependent dehydrogenase (short-subunit alcohol dehydrogenase family)
MARVLITGSADGLGRMAAELLVDEGHAVTLHARNDERAVATTEAVPGAEAVVVGDLSTLAGMRQVAEHAASLGRFDAVIQNAGIGYQERRRVETADGFEHVFAVNVLAPYVLTALLPRPDRIVVLSSGMSKGGQPDLTDAQWSRRRWNGAQAYSDSKLFDAVLVGALARRWPDVLTNAVDPGWVPTRMGGPSAPDDLSAARFTQAWLATSDDAAAHTSGGYWYHQQQRAPHPAMNSHPFQDELLAYCAELSSLELPS